MIPNVPLRVWLACALCMACVALGAVLPGFAVEPTWMLRTLTILGALGIAVETFRWGGEIGYPVKGQAFVIGIVNALRCIAMTFVLFMVSGVVALAALIDLAPSVFRTR